jgi:hypothetical protein
MNFFIRAYLHALGKSPQKAPKDLLKSIMQESSCFPPFLERGTS